MLHLYTNADICFLCPCNIILCFLYQIVTNIEYGLKSAGNETEKPVKPITIK